jgi:UDP-N-acetylmuramoylalanine--D-glutamate ligase
MGGRIIVSFLATLPGKRVLVFGAGVTGKPTIEFLEKQGAVPLIVDEKIDAPGVFKELSEINLEDVSFGVVSPGWKHDNPLISEAKSLGIELVSEIDLAWRVKSEIAPDQRWLALTGTNGKTTTVQMAEAIINTDGINAVACGNVGYTAIEAVLNTQATVLVLELSSFQLEWSHEAEFVSVAILNIAQDHIDWHQSFENYAAAKFKITNKAGMVILNAHDEEIVRRARNVNKDVIWFSLETPAPHQIGLVENLIVDRAFISAEAEALCELADIKPAVPHNVLNAMAAAALARSIGVKADSVAIAMRDFKLDHHRLEVVAEKDGVIWIDDSKATNPHAAIAALQSQLKSVWIAGGLAKGAAMDEIAQRCGSRIKAAILIGTDAAIIESAFTKHAPDVPIHLIKESDGISVMRAAVAKAAEIAESGEAVLLAPACASMDQFKNYAQRGEFFAQAVKEQLDA